MSIMHSMNRLKNAMDRRGLTIRQATALGAPYHNLFKQYHGLRSIGPKAAILYERLLGIPRSELRPDLWPPADKMPETELAEN